MTTEAFGERRFEIAGKKIWVAGHRGLVGQALLRRLARENCSVLTCGRDVVDLRRQTETEAWVADAKPDAVILAAAKVGGILANHTRPAEFLYDNLAIELNVIEAARRAGVAKLVLLGSSCIYPRLARQPISEDELLSGPLEPTNQWYSIAKITGIKLAQAYRRQYELDCISLMPSNLYGPGDNFDLETSHVLPALLRKTHEAKVRGSESVTIWGTGNPRREFLHVDDCADAVVHLLKHYSSEEPINVGTGSDVTIRELAERIARIVEFEGRLQFDTSKPDGTPQKLLDVGRLNATGWRPKIDLAKGISDTYQWFLRTHGQLKLT